MSLAWKKLPRSGGRFEAGASSSYDHIAPYVNSLALAMAVMSLLWVFSLTLKDASIVDRFWGLGFVILILQQLLQNRFLTFRAALILILVMLWGLRLSLFIHFRNRGKPEDARYQEMRKARGTSFWWKSYFMVFLLQGFLMWVISAPLAVIHLFPQSDVPTTFDFLGIVIWAIGFIFETLSDYQLARFKQRPENRGKICRAGLWSISRHPNYFGESLIWWGYFLIAANVDYGWITVFSPVIMTFLLLRVSGVSLLERRLHSTKPGYAEYVRQVPAFLPFGKRN